MRIDIFAQRLERLDVGLHLRLLFVNLIKRVMQILLIVHDLGADVLPRLMDEMPVMLPFDAPLQAERNEQTDRDRRQVYQDVAPAMCRFLP